ncbi:hypothetical protein TruAng_008710 [Truncatella angustata]|nr:hypothetical protein TruAng_008710 [Truncatella angustata]
MSEVEAQVRPTHRNDAFSFNNIQYPLDSSTHSQRAGSAPPDLPPYPPYRVDGEPAIKRERTYRGDNTARSIFKENFENLGILATEEEPIDEPSTSIGADLIAQGARSLAFLKDRYVVNDFIDRWFTGCEGADDISIEGVLKAWLRGLWLCHGETLERQDPDQLLRLSELLWTNTKKPLEYDGNTSILEWADRATGPNIRWEVIGTIAATIGICVKYVDPTIELFKIHKIDRNALAKQVNIVSNACVKYTQKCGVFDDLYVWLLNENWTCSVLVQGLNKYESYKQGGEVISTIVYLKWHLEIEANAKIPFFLAELRKRARACAFCAEIGGASFHGRPPRLQYHYWNMEPPLDLSDKELMLDRAELEPVLRQLDKNGFGTAEIISRGTWYRTWVSFCMRRADILDLSLRAYTDEELLRLAEEIERKTEEHWQNLPTIIRDARHQRINPAHSSLKQLYLTILRQGTRSNELLLQRVLIRRKLATPERMIRIAQAALKDVLEAQTNAEMASNYQLDLTALIVVHGLRAAAIIASELFKQEQLPVYPIEPLLPRSQTIRDLSVFEDRLANVDPSDGLYEMSQSGRNMLSFVLDKILDHKGDHPVSASQQCPNPESHEQSQQQQIGYGQMEVDMVGNSGVQYVPYMGNMIQPEFTFEPPEYLMVADDNAMTMQWLDSVDWERQGPPMGFL